jgi:hypothetical protein
MVPGLKPMDPIDYPNLWKVADQLRFNVLDPLNTSGSLILNQDPNDPDFLKVQRVAIAGVQYSPSRCVIMQNEDPIYIEYTTSAFGYVGRSCYQRALLPLKSFIQSMITDDLVTIKAGILVAKQKSPGSFVDNIMQGLFQLKANLLKMAKTGNVLTIGAEDDIVSLDLQNIEGAMSAARKNILENIAVADDMPAILLNQESFAEGLSDGTEDAKAVNEYIDDFRVKMDPLYRYFTKIVQHLAWNPEFYKTVQKTFPDDWGGVDYNTAFYRWTNSFTATWPSLMREPESELIKKDAVKLEAMIAQLTVLLPVVDPENKTALVQWTVDNFNSLKLLFPNPLVIDSEALLAYFNDQQSKIDESHTASLEPKEPAAPKKFGDSGSATTISNLAAALARLERPASPPPPRRLSYVDSVEEIPLPARIEATVAGVGNEIRRAVHDSVGRLHDRIADLETKVTEPKAQTPADVLADERTRTLSWMVGSLSQDVKDMAGKVERLAAVPPQQPAPIVQNPQPINLSLSLDRDGKPKTVRTVSTKREADGSLSATVTETEVANGPA